jgi:tetratricopeptide (TPR) repeat protein
LCANVYLNNARKLCSIDFMPYVRERGNHLAIVHGARHPTTRKVEQQVLLTIHSKAEALAALGRTGDGADGRRFRALLEHRYPTIRFDWDELERGLAEMMDRLPDLARTRDERSFGDFRENLLGFTRQLAWADPQSLESARALLVAHREELTWLAELLRWRLDMLDRAKTSEWTRDPFGWRLALQAQDVPPETEELATELFDKGEIDRAEKVFGLLVEAFPTYADGWNYLGLIALRRGQLPAAIEHFEKTIRIGRTLLPKKLAKKSYWTLLETRPYMRGLRNLAIALVRAGRYDEALTTAKRLETECGDALAASVYRTFVHMNRGEWWLVLEGAGDEAGEDAEGALMVALAAFELGRLDQARMSFVRASLSAPRTVAMVLGYGEPPPTSSSEAREHNGRVDLRDSLAGYLARRSAKSKRFTRALWDSERLVSLRAEVVKLEKAWASGRGEDRRPFDRLREMRGAAFAKRVAAELGGGAERAEA